MTRRRGPVGALALLALVGGCGYGGGLEDARRESAAPPVVVTVNPAEAPDGVVTYLEVRKSPEHGASTEGGRRVQDSADVGKLTGASADFKSFVGWQLRANVAAVKAGLSARGKETLPARCDLAARITVWGVAPAVATAREWWCTRDANEVIWVKDGDTWRVAARMRGGWDCSVLDRYHVPAIITAAVCFEKDGETRRYTGPS